MRLNGAVSDSSDEQGTGRHRKTRLIGRVEVTVKRRSVEVIISMIGCECTHIDTMGLGEKANAVTTQVNESEEKRIQC